jgi:multiple sugar transport system permease protein
MNTKLWTGLRTIFLVLIIVLWLVPVWLMIVNAVTPSAQYSGTPTWWPADLGLLTNLTEAWETGQMGPGFLNSLFYSTICAAAAVVLAALAGFGTVVLKVRHKTLWFWLIYCGTLVPLQIFLAPMFTAAARSDLYDTRLGLMIVYVAIAIPFAYFLMRNFITTLPREVFEASAIDGAGPLMTFLRICVPMCRPAMFAAFIFQFTWAWNDLLFGMTLTASPEVRPIMASLINLNGNYSSVGPPTVLAGALIASVPTVAIFFLFQRFFVSSLTLSK